MKYSSFYDFKEIIGDSLIITPLFLIEFNHPNCKVKVKKKSIYKSNISNLNT